ncbi:MAG: TIGR04283 family arsenosugar biosynthesis glycosyltransferase [Paracoccaceae bacterium]
MPAPLSIVIPTLNSADQLPATLACLMEGLESGLVRELVISDGGSSDASMTIADEMGAKLVTGATGRGGQLKRGALAAAGDWMLILHADTHLSSGWAAVVQAHIQTSVNAGYFKLRFRANGFRPRFFEAGANLRSRLGLPYGDQGLLISRKLYDSAGGFQDIALMEDVAMVKTLRGRLGMLPTSAHTDPARYQQHGWYRRGLRNMWTLLLYKMGVEPGRLAAYYNR